MARSRYTIEQAVQLTALCSEVSPIVVDGHQVGWQALRWGGGETQVGSGTTAWYAVLDVADRCEEVRKRKGY
jgi:hypothetical protein